MGALAVIQGGSANVVKYPPVEFQYPELAWPTPVGPANKKLTLSSKSLPPVENTLIGHPQLQ